MHVTTVIVFHWDAFDLSFQEYLFIEKKIGNFVKSPMCLNFPLFRYRKNTWRF